MGRLLLIAVRNLRQNPKRTSLLGGAIAGVTLLLVLLSAVSNGMQDTMLRAATTLSTGHVNVSGFYKITSGHAAPVVTHYEPIFAVAEEEAPEGAFVVDRLRAWGKIISPNSSIQVGISGVDISQEANFREVIQVVSGDLDDLLKPGSACLFQSQADRLQVVVGDTLIISAPTVRGAQNTTDISVVAIAKPIGLISAWNIFVTKDVVRDLYLMEKHATGAVQIFLDDPEDAEEVAGRLRNRLEGEYRLMEPIAEPFWMKFPMVTREDWTGQKLDLTTWKGEMKFLNWTLSALNAITAVLVGILLVLIVVGMMNAMWIAIRERTREIGTLRAIGMQRTRVLSMILIEAGVLSLGATIVGALLGVVVSLAVNAIEIPVSQGFQLFLMRDTLRLVVDVPTVLRAIGIIASITTIFCLIPAYRATRLKPITAIHHVG